MELKDRLLELREINHSIKIGEFEGMTVYSHSIGTMEISIAGYVTEPGRNYPVWRHKYVTWEGLETPEHSNLKEWLEKRLDSLTPTMEIEKDKHLIKFHNPETGEGLICNLRDKKFTKVKVDGRCRDIAYPHYFFKYKLGHLLLLKIPTDLNFAKLIKQVIKHETRCRNFGTFLVRMFDKIHLETYISLDKPYQYDIAVPYNWFDKDVRKALDGINFTYNPKLQAFFVSNPDKAKAWFNIIKDESFFKNIFNLSLQNAHHINLLIDQYNYDVKRLYEYAKSYAFTTRVHPQWEAVNKIGQPYTLEEFADTNFSAWNFNFFSEMADYVRNASIVYGENFDKYPKNLKIAHDEAAAKYEIIKHKYDEEKFKQLIDEKLEFTRKDFSIVHPKSTAEVILEGKTLGHCVGSYVPRLLTGETKVVFLRNNENINEPCLTLEIRDYAIRQVQGKNGRGPNYDEKQFLLKYAKEKNLSYK